MGTSSSNRGTRGKGTPQIPTWVSEDPGNLVTMPSGAGATHNPMVADQVIQELPDLPPEADKNRFQAPRTNFSRFVISAGRDTSNLHKAVHGYINRSLGGTRNASRNMGASRMASARILNLFSDIVNHGAQQVLESLKLGNLYGKPITDIFLGLSDFICPEGGTTDSGIARYAFTNTIIELEESGISNIEDLNNDQMNSFFGIYIANTIEGKLYNEIGNNGIIVSATPDEAAMAQKQLHEFIQGAVNDAIVSINIEFKNITPEKIMPLVDNIYNQAFEILLLISSSKED